MFLLNQGPVIENISQRCGGFLKYLSLRGCQSVGDQSIRYKFLKCTRHGLAVSDSSVWMLFIFHFKSLLCSIYEYFFLFSLSFYLHYRTLAQHCHNIERLDLSDCKKITDQAIYAISKHCSKLTAINLESCVNITDKSLKNVADGCPVRWMKEQTCGFQSFEKSTIFLFFVLMQYFYFKTHFVCLFFLSLSLADYIRHFMSIEFIGNKHFVVWFNNWEWCGGARSWLPKIKTVQQ